MLYVQHYMLRDVDTGNPWLLTYNNDVVIPAAKQRREFTRMSVQRQGLVGRSIEAKTTQLVWLVNLNAKGIIPAAVSLASVTTVLSLALSLSSPSLSPSPSPSLSLPLDLARCLALSLILM